MKSVKLVVATLILVISLSNIIPIGQPLPNGSNIVTPLEHGVGSV
ncbi:hypothetical protein [Paenibacillus glacialis]|nr:hypothetical protein [Paenibacillus glacialis]